MNAFLELCRLSAERKSNSIIEKKGTKTIPQLDNSSHYATKNVRVHVSYSISFILILLAPCPGDSAGIESSAERKGWKEEIWKPEEESKCCLEALHSEVGSEQVRRRFAALSLLKKAYDEIYGRAFLFHLQVFWFNQKIHRIYFTKLATYISCLSFKTYLIWVIKECKKRDNCNGRAKGS